MTSGVDAATRDQQQHLDSDEAGTSRESPLVLLSSSPGSRQQSEEKPNFRHAAPILLEEMKIETAEIDQVQQKIKQPQQQQKRSSFAWRQRLQDVLFHRSEEEAAILRSYESMLKGEAYSLLLIQGAIGTGKTRLARHSLQDRVRGYFLTGKFDQLQRPEPYRGFVAAFTEFTSQVVERGTSEIEKMRDAIVSAVGDEVCVLTSMIPALEQILGDHRSNNSNAKADDAIQRFVFVFRMFMRAVSSLEQPMVLLLDDLQFADPCSLDLLTSIVTDLRNNPGLFLIATCDDSNGMMDEQTYVSRKLRDMEKGDNNAPITRVSVRNLDEGEVNHLLGNALQLSRLEETEDLGKIVSGQTNGNLFYIIEFIRWLQDSGLLYFENGSWFWDAEEIRMTIDVKRIGDFLVDRLEQLPMQMRDVLKVAACFGSYVEEELIEYVLGYPVSDILADAAKKGIIVLDVSDILANAGENGTIVLKASRLKYRFEHDGMQEAAYNLISESERELFHLEVGRRLWRRLSKDELDRNIFVLLSQINIGKRLITREKERYAIASLCLHAGKKAAKSSTFRTAAVYLNLGIELLGERGWRDEYDLALALFNAAAEMQLCVANYEAMESLIEAVLKHARIPGDKIQARATQIYAMGMTERQQESIDLGVEILKSLGERFPRILCKAHLKGEMKSVKKLLRGVSNEKILRLPIIDDAEKLACMQILNLLFLNALLVRPKLSPFITLKMMKLTLTHGLSMIAPQAFGCYGMLCISAMEDIDGALRFGELGLELLDKLEVREYLPRVYAGVYGCIYPWKKPLRDTLAPLLHAHRVGMQTGDVEFGSLNANLYCFVALEAGVTLDRIESDWRSFQETMVSHRQEALLRMSWPCVQAIHHYMGLSPDPLAAKGDLVDYDIMLKKSIESGAQSTAMGIRLNRMTIAYVFNDYELADSFAKITINAIWTLPPTIEIVTTSFITGMVALAIAATGKHYFQNVRHAKKVIRLLKKYARNCPFNSVDKKFLLEAELAFVQRKDAKAFEKYTCAIALAKDNGFLFNQALATERTARFFVARGKLQDALPYFRKAHSLYNDWGGRAKASRLKDEMDLMFKFNRE